MASSKLVIMHTIYRLSYRYCDTFSALSLFIALLELYIILLHLLAPVEKK